MSWFLQAACLGSPAEIFFPTFVDGDGNEVLDDGTIFESYGDTTEFYEEARTICTACPVMLECRQYAMENRERFGMWGGQTPIERRRVERSERRQRLHIRRRAEAIAAAAADSHEDEFADTLDEE
jgi:WhiB family transcriptional regulator, redox-sensing transcriptional regulator